MGYKIYGSPWSLRFYDWAFNVDPGEPALKIWKQIPSDTEILLTHGPPYGYGDLLDGIFNPNKGQHCGDKDLLKEI